MIIFDSYSNVNVTNLIYLGKVINLFKGKKAHKRTKVLSHIKYKKLPDQLLCSLIRCLNFT
jgi:hypothetical protein